MKNILKEITTIILLAFAFAVFIIVTCAIHDFTM